MNIHRAAVGLTEVKFAPDAEVKGTFTGYGAVFGNLDAYGDVIAKGAFKQTLREWEDRGKLPPMLLQHGGGMFGGGVDDKVPIGKWDHMEENSKGLKVEGHLFATNTDRGQYILAGLKEGVLDGLSIGFRIRKQISGTKPGEPARTLTDIDLGEVSLVTFPANPKARVSTVKSLTVDELRELEVTLRDAGLSRRDCERAVSTFKAYLLRDVGVPTTGLRDEDEPAKPTDVKTAADRLLRSLTVGALRV
jgi:Escherichia/Staphylococcus phage prohead protease